MGTVAHYDIHNMQEFSSDMGSRPVKRISDVSRLRNYQFPQVFFIFQFFGYVNFRSSD